MLKAALSRYKLEPVKFVKEILGAEPDLWQAETLKALARNSRVAVRSGHGVGKTALESWAVLWFLFTRPCCKVPCTAPTIQQLYKILWSELAKWLKRSALLQELFEWTKTELRFKLEPARWLALARTAARAENMAGFHDAHLLFVIDEASGVDDSIFEAIEGALTTADSRLLMCGNPTRNSGFFKRAFYESRELYWTAKVSSASSGRVSQEYSARLISQYGEDSDVVRVRVFGEFPKSESDGLIALELVEAAMQREPIYDGELVIGVDVARFGDDETVICARVGLGVAAIEHYRKSDLMTTVGRIMGMLSRLMKKYSLSQGRINVDDDGVGGGVTDRIREVIAEKGLQVTVVGCHNGGKARDSHYGNWATESWFSLRDRLAAGEIMLPRDDELAAQLSTRKYTLNSRDQLILESKSEYKRRHKRSPDRADALVLCYAPVATISMPNFATRQSYWR